MKKQLVIIGVILLLMSAGLSGCTNNNKPLTSEELKFVGKWRNAQLTNYTMDIYANRTFISSWKLYGVWNQQNGLFTLDYTVPDTTYTYTYAFSNDNNTLNLVLTSDVNVTYTYLRQ